MKDAAHLGPKGVNIPEVASLPLDGALDDLVIYSGSWYRHNGSSWAQISGSALADPGANGVVVRTALNTTTARTITGSTSITVADGNGVSANPTITRAALTGDVTASADSNATTITNDAVTNAKLANVATATIKGRVTAGTGDPEDLTATQAKSVLAITASDVSGLATIATSGSAADLSAGIIPDARMPDLTGDVTTSEGAVATTIASDAVTNTKLANMATATIKGRVTAGTGDPEDLTATQAKSVLAITASDVSGLATIATTGSASDLSAGTVAAARMPALTGDVTTSAGAVATTIANDAVTNAKLANVATATIKGRTTAGTGDPEDLTAAQAKAVLAITSSDVSGLAAIATSGSASDLSAGIIPDARMPDLTGDVTTSEGAVATTIASDAVTNAKLANMATQTIKGRTTAGTGDPEDLTAAQVRTILGLAAIATSGSAADLSAGIIPDARMPDLTGDVTTSEGAVATTIANDAVTYAKMQNVSADSKLLGRGSAAGSGDVEEITLGTNLSMSGTTLNASGGGISDGDKGDITVSSSGTVWTIDNAAVSYAKIQDVSAASKLLGRGAAIGAGDVEEISISTGLSMSGTTLSSTCVPDPGADGIVIRNGSTSNARTLTGDSSITVTNGNGTAGNPTVSRAALTGDITASAGSNATTIAAAAVTNAKLANMATQTIKGRTTAGTGDPEDLTAAQTRTILGLAAIATSGSASDLSTGTVPAARLASALARFSSISPTSITSATSATLNTWHVISGTSADYTITISGLSPTTGDVLGFYVKDNAAADKQYKLDAGGTVKIAGRTRYLILLHTNCVVLQWDGTDWQPLVLNLDTPWATASTPTITATTLNPSKGTVSVDSLKWRRIGTHCEVVYRYRQTTAGTSGTGSYILTLPIGAADSSLSTITSLSLSATDSATWGVVCVGYGNLTSGTGGTTTVEGMALRTTTTVSVAGWDSGNYRYALGGLNFSLFGHIQMADW
jgi:phage-related protein